MFKMGMNVRHAMIFLSPIWNCYDSWWCSYIHNNDGFSCRPSGTVLDSVKHSMILDSLKACNDSLVHHLELFG